MIDDWSMTNGESMEILSAKKNPAEDSSDRKGFN